MQGNTSSNWTKGGMEVIKEKKRVPNVAEEIKLI